MKIGQRKFIVSMSKNRKILKISKKQTNIGISVNKITNIGLSETLHSSENR